MRLKRLFVFSTLLIAMGLRFPSVEAASVREALPWTASFEVMGRAVLYGLSVERSVSETSSWGLALARAEAQASGEAQAAATTLIPLSYFRYLSAEGTAPFLCGGLTWVTHSSDVGGRGAILGTLRYPSIPWMAHFGIGWELRQENGFLFRLQGLLTRSSAFSFSSGFNLGVAF